MFVLELRDMWVCESLPNCAKAHSQEAKLDLNTTAFHLALNTPSYIIYTHFHSNALRHKPHISLWPVRHQALRRTQSSSSPRSVSVRVLSGSASSCGNAVRGFMALDSILWGFSEFPPSCLSERAGWTRSHSETLWRRRQSVSLKPWIWPKSRREITEPGGFKAVVSAGFSVNNRSQRLVLFCIFSLQTNYPKKKKNPNRRMSSVCTACLSSSSVTKSQYKSKNCRRVYKRFISVQVYVLFFLWLVSPQSFTPSFPHYWGDIFRFFLYFWWNTSLKSRKCW